MNPLTIVVTPDGAARCVWTEALPLHELGRLDVKRAFSVEFDNQVQAWRVYDAMGDCVYCSPSRETCLSWERRYLHWALENP